ITHYKTLAGKEVASVQSLELKVSELERYKADAAAEIRALGIKLRKVESVATTTSQTEVRITAPLHDTVIVCQCDTVLVHDTVQLFRWRDAWCRVEGAVLPDSVVCQVKSIDTLRQIVHRVPRRFLFIRWGTKAIRQEIVSANPHTRIVYAEYIDMRKKRK
ncbi:MAG: hypothetical protein K2G58_06940, partial [Alistipes sp.]|nr:hypothetical protein [Alistipes sp.]